MLSSRTLNYGSSMLFWDCHELGKWAERVALFVPPISHLWIDIRDF